MTTYVRVYIVKLQISTY